MLSLAPQKRDGRFTISQRNFSVWAGITIIAFLVVFSAARHTRYPKAQHGELQRRILQIHYQSQGIPIAEWLAQFTLCLAPFAAHVLIGVPMFIFLSDNRPSVWTQINFFNPMTIVWRYFMIADRRLRSTNWTAEDMAASNAAFWTGNKWDGSENMMVRSREWIIRRPPSNRISFISISMLGTIIVTVQGVQALYQLTQIIWTGLSPIQALADMFIPLAVGSLFRLPAALWLTDDIGYDESRAERVFSQHDSLMSPPELGNSVSLHDMSKQAVGDFKSLSASSTTCLVEDSWPLTPVSPMAQNPQESPPEAHLRPQTHWKATLLRFAYVFALLSIVGVFGLGHLLAQKEAPSVASLILVHFMYTSFCLVLFILSLYWLIARKATSTLIPCINSTWYTVFTIIWYAFVAVCIVMNCIEMRRTRCGVYTTYPISYGLDNKLCNLYEN